MDSPRPTPLYALPNLAPISMTGNHEAGFTLVADMNSLYSPTAYLCPSVSAYYHTIEPTNAPINPPLLTGYSSSAVPDSTNHVW